MGTNCLKRRAEQPKVKQTLGWRWWLSGRALGGIDEVLGSVSNGRKKCTGNWACWYMPTILTVRSWMQEDQNSKVRARENG